MKQKITTFLLTLIMLPIGIFAQNSMNMVLMGTYEWPSLNTEGSDIWGWVDNSTNEEYALVGLNDGFSVVDVSNGNGNNSGDEVYTTSRSFSEATSSININENENSITTFVNPLSKDIMINAEESIRISNLKVTDISSKLVYSKKEVLLPTTINVDFLDPGIYIITMNTVNGEKITKKLLLP